jgi:hypothetical protein
LAFWRWQRRNFGAAIFGPRSMSALSRTVPTAPRCLSYRQSSRPVKIGRRPPHPPWRPADQNSVQVVTAEIVLFHAAKKMIDTATHTPAPASVIQRRSLGWTAAGTYPYT